MKNNVLRKLKDMNLFLYKFVLNMKSPSVAGGGGRGGNENGKVLISLSYFSLYYSIFFQNLKGLSFEIDFENVDEN
jgi:hypothetical protein